MASTHLHRDLFSCMPATTSIIVISSTHTHGAEWLQRLWVCDVRCGQGVSGLALTTEQGSVLCRAPIWLFLYIGTQRAAQPVRATEGQWAWEKPVEKQTALSCFLGFGGAQLPQSRFSVFNCCKQGGWHTLAWSFTVWIKIQSLRENVHYM